jgi:hypothetical protein
MVRCGAGNGNAAQAGGYQTQQQQDLISTQKSVPYSSDQLAHPIAPFHILQSYDIVSPF